MRERTRLMRAASVVGLATLLSRILGFVRDAAIAWYFGAGFASDAFIAAFRLPNVFRRLFGEGAFSSAVVPVFTEVLYQHGKQESNRLAGDALRLLALILGLVAGASILLAPWLVRLIAPGFEAEKYQLTVTLTRIMLPYVFFVCLVALSSAILNVYHHFAAPALSPVMLNLGMIGAIFLIAPQMDVPIVGLAIGVIIGGFLQLALQFQPLIRQGVAFWRHRSLFHPAMRSIGRLMLPVILGAAVYQINILISTLLGTLLAEGSVTVLYFADRLVQFPLGLFAIAATTAVLPSLSRQAAAGDWRSYKETLGQGIRIILFLTVPAMVGLIILAEPIVALLFERGQFDAAAVQLTAGALSYYAIGLWAVAAVRIIAAGYFALQDTKTPLKAALVSIGANLVLGAILMRSMAQNGLALATSIASMLNLTILVFGITLKLEGLPWRRLLQSMLRTVAVSCLMGVGVWALAETVLPVSGPSVFYRAAGLISVVAVGMLIYLGLSWMLNSRELAGVMAELKKTKASHE
jgi:putative peptidoglycan lipid II flippase